MTQLSITHACGDPGSLLGVCRTATFPALRSAKEKIMNGEIRILMLEHVASDSELVEQELDQAGVTFSSRRVQTREDYLKEVLNYVPDIILADSKLPQFNFQEAHRLLQEQNLAIPFVLVI